MSSDRSPHLKHLEQPDMLPDWTRHALTIPPPEADYDTDPRKCYKINQMFVKALIAVVDYYCHSSSFEGTEEEKKVGAKRFEDLQVYLMIGEYDCQEFDMSLKLRQSPTDPCVFQVSYDSGTTWETAFDYGLCFAQHPSGDAKAVANAVANSSAYINQQIAVYDQTLGSIAPGMVHDQGELDEYRDKAMCLWIHDILEISAAVALALRDAGSGVWESLQRAIIQANIYVVDILVWLEENVSPVPDVIGTAVYRMVRKTMEDQLDALNEDDLAALQNTAIREAIQCFIMDQWEGLDVTETMYRAMFDGIATLEGVSPELETFLNSLIDTEESYVAALSALDVLPEKLQSGEVVYICPCSTWEAEVLLELVQDPDPYNTGANMGGFWTPDYWYHKDAKRDPASSYYYRSLSLKATFPECNLTQIEIADYTLLAFAYDDAAVWINEQMGIEGKSWAHSNTGYHIGFTTPVFNWNVTQVNILLTCDRDTNIGQLNGATNLYSLLLRGKGYNPFI